MQRFDFLREAEAAETAGLAPSTLAKMRSRSDGPPFVKVGRQVRYSERALLKWVESRIQTSCEAL